MSTQVWTGLETLSKYYYAPHENGMQYDDYGDQRQMTLIDSLHATHFKTSRFHDGGTLHYLGWVISGVFGLVFF